MTITGAAAALAQQASDGRCANRKVGDSGTDDLTETGDGDRLKGKGGNDRLRGRGETTASAAAPRTIASTVGAARTC